ncbi:MAG: 30S ribosomal protein S12 methylthiotransferase RimO, partial [Bulleidia sp.]|nr:30S ribosomal protein S12 methylthiotransferase RimO [Bulleidia sp.]
SLGCAKNLVDTENVLGMLQFSNQEITTSYEEAEAIIINTCGFIESAKSEAIETILNTADLKQKNLKKLIVMGCLAKRYKPQLEKEMPEVDRFISIDEYKDMGTILSEALGVRIANGFGFSHRVLSGKPWMAYLQISDGCDNRCSFCAIPGIRGRLHSVPMDQVLEEAKRLASIGVKEITLVAQDCSRYGFDFDRQLHLTELLKELDQIEGIHWIRMLYLYPDEIPDGLIETIQNSKHIVPYFDIPTQHGSDKILHLMRRKTSRQKILDLTSEIRERMPNAILRTTLITGFPGETLEDHEATLSMISQVKFDRLGAFTFSKEEGTAAYEMEETVSEEEKLRRKNEILAVQQEIGITLLQARVGREYEVLIESKDPLTGMYIGRSNEFAPDNVDGNIRFRSDKDHEQGGFTHVKITKVSGQNLIGEEL